MADLKTNYVDDKLNASTNQLRKYQQIKNDDGTVSFVDVTDYTETGTSFGANDINATNKSINKNTADIEALNLKMDSAREKLLWSNSDTTKSFATQTITLDLSDYDYVDILFKATTTYTGSRLIRCVKAYTAVCCIPGYVAKNTITGSSYNAINLRRIVSVGSSGAINFGNGIVDTSADNANGNANVMIPAKIYGVTF